MCMGGIKNMTRNDFVFSVGFQGVSAIVDKAAKRKYGKLSTRELAEKGLYRSAFCSALFSQDEEEIKAVMEIYNSRSKTGKQTAENMKRLLGVFNVPDNITKVINI